MPETIWFVGSGVSRWSGLPSWEGLVELLAEFLESLGRSSDLVRRELSSGELLQAGSYGFSQLTPAEQSSFLKSAIQHGVAMPSALHELLGGSGARCFVTTNYDQLLEVAIRNAGANVDVVTGSQRLEIASILQSSAEGFVFKPHGDISNHSSIVFTSEDYREMFGDLRHVSAALKTLLVSRPVVYLGFGLRDPDFKFALDTMATTFRTLPTDHFALVKFATPEERAYWRHSQGIELVSFGDSPSVEHTQLLPFVKAVLDSRPGSSESRKLDRLVLARHSNSTASATFTSPPTFKLSCLVRAEGRDRHRRSHSNVVEFLLNGPADYLLIGQPGSGKSTVIQQVAHQVALNARDALLGSGPLSEIRVPVLVRLREYRGDLSEMLKQSMPAELDLKLLESSVRLVFFLDGLNEVARQHVESGRLREDLARLREAWPNAQLILTSRFVEDWPEPDAQIVDLAEVPISEVIETLSPLVNTHGLPHKVLEHIRRPLFLRLLLDGRIKIDDLASINRIYSAVFDDWAKSMAEHVGESADYEGALGRLAHGAIALGAQLVDVSDVRRELAVVSPHSGGPDAEALLDAMLDCGFLVPHTNSRLAFPHHSIAEYLAAREVAKVLQRDIGQLEFYLSKTAWDHTLLLSLGFLEPEVAASVFSQVLDNDLKLAIRGIAYLEQDRAAWVTALLLHVASWKSQGEHLFALDLSYEDVHYEPLVALSARGDSIGGHALGAAWSLRPENAELVAETLTKKARDYNFCSAFGNAADVNDAAILKLLDLLESSQIGADDKELLRQNDEKSAFHGLVHGLVPLIYRLGIESFKVVATRYQGSGNLLAAIVLEAAWHIDDVFTLDYLTSALLSGSKRAIFGLHLRIGRLARASKVDVEPIDRADEVAAYLLDGASRRRRMGRWSAELLQSICAGSDRIRALVGTRVGDWPPSVTRAALEHIAGSSAAIDTLRTIATNPQGISGSDAENFDLLSDLPWSENAELLVHLLKGMRPAAATHLAGSIDVGANVAIPALPKFLEWCASQDDYWLRTRLGELLSRSTDESTQFGVIREFDGSSSSDQSVFEFVALFVVPHLPDDLVHLSPAIAERLLVQLESARFHPWPANPLAFASKELVEDILLVRFTEAERGSALHRNLKKVLYEVGRRHGRRYLNDEGDPIAG